MCIVAAVLIISPLLLSRRDALPSNKVVSGDSHYSCTVQCLQKERIIRARVTASDSSSKPLNVVNISPKPPPPCICLLIGAAAGNPIALIAPVGATYTRHVWLGL